MDGAYWCYHFFSGSSVISHTPSSENFHLTYLQPHKSLQVLIKAFDKRYKVAILYYLDNDYHGTG